MNGFKNSEQAIHTEMFTGLVTHRSSPVPLLGHCWAPGINLAGVPRCPQANETAHL